MNAWSHPALLGVTVWSPSVKWVTRLGGDVWDDSFRVRVEGLLGDLAQKLLGQGQSVILAWGHWARVERDEKRIGAQALGVGVELHYRAAPIEVLVRRAERHAARGEWTAAPITREHFESWATVFQPPDEAEMRLFDDPASD